MSEKKKRELDIVDIAVPVFVAGRRRPNANSASDMNVLADICRAVANMRIVWGDHDSIKLSRRNMVITLNRHQGVGSGTGTGEVLKMTIVEHHGDYLVCSYGGSNYNVAKLPALRFSSTTETIDGTEYTYSDHSEANQTRVATWSGGTETQVIVPRYHVGGTIFVTSADATGVTVSSVECTYVECSDGRAWARQSTDKIIAGTVNLSAGIRSGTVTGLGLGAVPSQVLTQFYGNGLIFAVVTAVSASEFSFALSANTPDANCKLFWQCNS